MIARRQKRFDKRQMLNAPLDLPIDAILPQLLQTLSRPANAVLTAEPGAGKTTRVPLALMEAPWMAHQRIVMLEPRRLAARAAATRIAQQIGENLGATIGLRMRMERRDSEKTKILIVTEGVFARMILDDPTLEGIGAVIFDEFHERSLDADLGLALALDSQSAFRPDLRLLAMSATIEGARVAEIMDAATELRCEGRVFSVETLYLGRDPLERLETAMTRAVLRALHEQDGSILAFLPGQGEIERVARDLYEQIRDPRIVVAPLYGALEKSAQAAAIAPAARGQRKIVLATSVAQTSLTIEGVRVVIDSGLERAPRFEPGLGLTRLETIRASRASVDQRRGRAGRTAPGVCYRLWEAAATGALAAFPTPQIMNADLSSLALSLAEWGASRPKDLKFLDFPPQAAWAQAQKTLRELDALDADDRLTEIGRKLRAIPLAPRLAAMTLKAAAFGCAETAARIAIVLSERGLGGDCADIDARLERFVRENTPRAKAARALAKNFACLAGGDAMGENCAPLSTGALVALAYPERLARARGRQGEFLMANGRAGALEAHHLLARAPYLAIAELAGQAGAQKILAAAQIDAKEIELLFGDKILAREEVAFNRARMAVEARATRRLGAIALEERQLKPSADDRTAHLLAKGLCDAIGSLPWSERQLQLRARIKFLRNFHPDAWPDLSDEALSRAGGGWLAPFIVGAVNLDEIDCAMLEAALVAMSSWDLAQRLDCVAPSYFQTPVGVDHKIDYEAEGGPAVHVRVQELFGLKNHPCVAGAPLVLHLLSPARRPIQITKDLPQFWTGSWKEVRTQMRGRYPKHAWPEDPANAEPTTRAKPKN